MIKKKCMIFLYINWCKIDNSNTCNCKSTFIHYDFILFHKLPEIKWFAVICFHNQDVDYQENK